MSDREVLDTKAFLRQLSNEYLDMEYLSKSIADKTKASDAINVAKEFRNTVRSAEKAMSDRNFPAVLEFYGQSNNLINQYLADLQDVPDEL
jgi:hypothetical protein